MQRYRKHDQYYIDEYDRQTIVLLKELESIYTMKLKSAQSLDEKQRLIIGEYSSTDSFYHKAVLRARNRAESIQASIEHDERRDRLVAKNPEPRNIDCKTCSSVMILCSHFFKEGPAEILFVFECPQGHLPKRAFYPNGKEFYLPERRCGKCNGGLQSATRRTKNKLIFTETCKECKSRTVDEIDFPKEEEPINEEDRGKYCTTYLNQNTFLEDLQVVAKLAQSLEEQRKMKQEQEKYRFDAVQKLKIPHLEQRLIQLTEKENYTKFSFEKPVFTSHTVIQFSVQDPTDRSEMESLKQLQMAMQADLFETNWRLAKSDLTYRMGYITGKVKGFEQDDDILKIAREIHKRGGIDEQ